MPRGLRCTRQPGAEPVSLTEAKLHLRVDISDDDALIARLVRAAREHVEAALDRQLASASYEATVDRFPRGGLGGMGADWGGAWQYDNAAAWQRLPASPLTGQWHPDRASIRLARPPLQAVTAITYVGLDGVTATVPTSTYDVDTTTEPGRIAPAWAQWWPFERQQLAGVKVAFVCGHGPATTIAADVTAGEQAVTPASMFGVHAGTNLAVGTGTAKEIVAVTAVTAGTFTATFAAAHTGPVTVGPGLPATIEQALMLLIGHWYENREAVATTGAVPKEMALAVESLLMAEWHGEYT